MPAGGRKGQEHGGPKLNAFNEIWLSLGLQNFPQSRCAGLNRYYWQVSHWEGEGNPGRAKSLTSLQVPLGFTGLRHPAVRGSGVPFGTANSTGLFPRTLQNWDMQQCCTRHFGKRIQKRLGMG